MPITAYVSPSALPYLIQVEDPELNELFQEVRRATGNRFFLRSHKRVRRGFLWFEDKLETVYELLADTGLGDFQVINFPPHSNNDGSINTYVTKPYVMSFFFGVLAGLKGENEATT